MANIALSVSLLNNRYAGVYRRPGMAQIARLRGQLCLPGYHLTESFSFIFELQIVLPICENQVPSINETLAMHS